jgi:rubrerythrin
MRLMSRAGALQPAELERSLANLKLERDAIVLYDRLASIEKDPRRAAAFRSIACNERRHAEGWRIGTVIGVHVA